MHGGNSITNLATSSNGRVRAVNRELEGVWDLVGDSRDVT